MNPSTSYCYGSGLDEGRLELPSPCGSGDAAGYITVDTEVPELTVGTTNPSALPWPAPGSDSQTHKGKCKSC